MSRTQSRVTDPYAVLGVAPSATDDEVRRAYRSRSMLLHPDLHQGRPEHVRQEADRAMTQLTQAYESVLSQRAQRAPRANAAPPPGGAESAAYRFGRMAGARSGVARDASVAGEQGGTFAYRLGFLVGRQRSH